MKMKKKTKDFKWIDSRGKEQTSNNPFYWIKGFLIVLGFLIIVYLLKHTLS